jgi:hypothetical protein
MRDRTFQGRCPGAKVVPRPRRIPERPWACRGGRLRAGWQRRYGLPTKPVQDLRSGGPARCVLHGWCPVVEEDCTDGETGRPETDPPRRIGPGRLMPTDGLARFCCQNPDCDSYGRRGGDDLLVIDHFGKARHRLLYCRVCKARFSELSARAVRCRAPRTPCGSWRGRPGPARAGIVATPRGPSPVIGAITSGKIGMRTLLPYHSH